MLQNSYLMDEVAIVLGTGRRTGDALRTSIQRWVNQACRKIAFAYPWWTRQAEQSINTVATYTDGTITVTNESTTVTGSGTTFTSAMVGRKLALAIGGPFYRISAYVSATEVTLAVAYKEDTASAQGYVIFQDEFDLAATTHEITDATLLRDRVLGPIGLFGQYVMDAADYPGTATGAPSIMGLCTSTTAGTPRIRLLPIPDDVYRVRIKYQPTWTNLSGDSDTPGLPDDCEELIIDRALRNAPKIEGSRRVMTDAQWEAELAKVYWGSRPFKHATGIRRGFGQTSQYPRIIVSLTGVTS